MTRFPRARRNFFFFLRPYRIRITLSYGGALSPMRIALFHTTGARHRIVFGPLARIYLAPFFEGARNTIAYNIRFLSRAFLSPRWARIVSRASL